MLDIIVGGRLAGHLAGEKIFWPAAGEKTVAAMPAGLTNGQLG